MSTGQDAWLKALADAGYVNRRTGKGGSWTALARAIDVHVSTLTAMANGTRQTEQEIVDKVADALSLDRRVVAEWVGRARDEASPFIPAEGADLMSNEERAAVNKLISLLVKPKIGGQTDAGQAEDQKSNLIRLAQPVAKAASKGHRPKRFDQDEQS